jgi:hypothetical protein
MEASSSSTTTTTMYYDVPTLLLLLGSFGKPFGSWSQNHAWLMKDDTNYQDCYGHCNLEFSEAKFHMCQKVRKIH